MPVRAVTGLKGKYQNIKNEDLYKTISDNQDIMYNELVNEDQLNYWMFLDIERKSDGLVDIDKIIETIEFHLNPIITRDFCQHLETVVIRDSTGLQRFRIYTNIACTLEM